MREGFARLLTGRGFELEDKGDGTWSLRPASGNVKTLPRVKVEASESRLDDPGRTEGSANYAAPSTNTAFKLPLTLRETPQTVTVVPQAAITDFGLTDIRKILLFMPGVYVSAERGPQAYYFEARGNGMQVQYDGVPSSNRFGGRGDGKTLDSATIDRVEVLHGATGLLTGPGSPGGTVNVFRKRRRTAVAIAAMILAGGVVWDLTRHFSAYASYSDIFEPQSIWTRDRNGQVLDPIVGENLETGLKLEAFDGKLNGALAVFRPRPDQSRRRRLRGRGARHLRR